MEQPLIIRGSLARQATLALGSLLFVVVGGMMLTLPPLVNSLLGWPTPVGQVVQVAVGVLAVMLGVAGLSMSTYAALRPILLLYPDRLIDTRRRLEIPFAGIRRMTTAAGRSTGSMQWLLLQMHDTAKYAGFECLSKQSGFTDADLTLDLTLASSADFEKACKFIAGHL